MPCSTCGKLPSASPLHRYFPATFLQSPCRRSSGRCLPSRQSISRAPREPHPLGIRQEPRPTAPPRDITLFCRIDTLDEVDYFRHGGILHFVLRQLLAQAEPAGHADSRAGRYIPPAASRQGRQDSASAQGCSGPASKHSSGEADANAATGSSVAPTQPTRRILSRRGRMLPTMTTLPTSASWPR